MTRVEQHDATRCNVLTLSEILAGKQDSHHPALDLYMQDNYGYSVVWAVKAVRFDFTVGFDIW